MEIEYHGEHSTEATAIAVNRHHVISGPVYWAGDRWRFSLTDQSLDALEAEGFEVKVLVHY